QSNSRHPHQEATLRNRVQEIFNIPLGEVWDRFSAIEAVGKLMTWVAEALGEPLSPAAAERSIEEIFSTGRVSPADRSRLLTTALRALRLPAREVWGLRYSWDGVQSFIEQRWIEVVIEGVWTPEDFQNHKRVEEERPY